MLKIDPARLEQYPAFVRLFAELETGDAPPTEAHFARELVADTIVATDEEGAIVGYAFSQIFGTACYVRHVVVDAGARRRGVGRALMLAIAERARSSGASGWQLNVKVTNAPALRLYESLGLRRAYETVVVRMPWRLAEAPPRAT